MASRHASAQSVAQILTAKRIAPSTIALIDPEKGTSTGGSSTDVRYAVGDILTFILQFTAVSNSSIRGLNGYITEYIPPNTEVVGLRIVDKNGNTIEPGRAGMAPDGWGLKSNANSMYSTWGLGDGSMAGVFADTGIFYSTSALTARVPANALPTVANGVQLVPAPSRANEFDELLGIPGGPYYIHNNWDWTQTMAYGTNGHQGAPPGGDINTSGHGNTPFLYGSAVAGPQTYYQYEATQTSPGTIVPNGTTGPWVRIAYPGSELGTGSAATSAGNYARVGVPTSAGYNLSTSNPLPSTANAVRFALGQLRVGQQYFVEVSLRVTGSPLDPGVGLDANCGEVFGGSGLNDKPDNTWAYALPSVNCVLLNLQFEKSVDKVLAKSGDTVTYTIKGKNLSTNTRTNVVVTDVFSASDLTLVSATGNPTVSGGTITWPTIGQWAPGAEFEHTVVMTISGVGQGSTFNTARIVYDQLPGGFSTQAVVNRIQVALLDLDMVAVPNQVSAGGTFNYQLSIKNDGSGDASNSGCSNNEGCVYAVTLPPGFSVVAGTSRVNGSLVGNPTASGQRYVWSSGILPVAAGATVTLSFDVQATTTPGLYTSCADVWLNSNGPFNDTECKLGPIAVGAARSDKPVITGGTNPAGSHGLPVLDTDTCISGTTTEADNTTITLYIGGIARGTTSASGGTWSICGFPPLFGGQIVTATAQAPGELVSVPSDPVTVLTLPKCSDGLDNDGDGLIDFPADPGCSSPTDSDETDPPTPQCSDGLDNDSDGLIDLLDPGCSGPLDNSENSAPECSDGVDNDGDGKIDYPADTGCTSANDPTEVSESLTACNDGIDNDGDGKVDFKADGTGDPGCHSANDNNETDDVLPSGDIKPRLLIVFDTSGSMNWNTCNSTFTGGDGSQTCPGADVSCATCSGSGCGNSVADDSRIDKVKRGITSVVGSYGSVEYALMRFHQRAMPFACPTDNASYQSGGWQGAGAAPCAGGFSAGDLLVGFADNNASDLLAYIDGSSNYSGTPPAGLDFELRGSGTTPLAGSLQSAHQYITRVRTADPKGPCRPYRVILVTDGLETCGGNPATVAASLAADNIKVSVIGFATSDSNIVTQLNSIAQNGGTQQALLVDNETSLALEVSKVISESLLSEKCNGVDDDCDGQCDETFPEVAVTGASCTNQHAAQTCTVGLGICKRTANYVCKADGSGSECNVTPGPPNPGGEICDNGLDDDCDGQIDEGCTPCVPQAEVCNGKDDNCNGQVDEGYVSVPCGSNIGECVAGTTACVNGQVVCNGATGPGTEVCDNKDNNCDTIVDLFSRSCYPPGANAGCNTSTGVCQGVCQVGTQTCVAGAWGQCLNYVGPTNEICNGLDDNCNGQVDEGVINTCTNYATCSSYTTCSQCPSKPAEVCDGKDNDCNGQIDDNALQVGTACGTAAGECKRGTFACVAGQLTCQGQVGPQNEVCDNKDNDCDGIVDNNIPGLGTACGSNTGTCKQGTTACVGGQTVCLGEVKPGTEVCDGQDNDCDGTVDNNIPSVPCGSDVGECKKGATACVNGQTVCQGAVGPGTEICDGKDNDCNGLVDDNPADVGTACGSAVGECKEGVTQCVAGQKVCTGGVGPQTEICDGKDNDCDGQVDNGIATVGDTCGSDVGECQKGTLACVNTPGSGYALVCQGSVGPQPEVCDGKDNNCDGQTDESFPEQGQTCSKNVGECKGGTYACEAGKLVCKGGTTPTPEVCDGLDNDCNGAIDDNVPGEGQPCGKTQGQCKAGATKCVGGQMICLGQIGPQKEICNGKDDDCDGQVDDVAECPGQSKCVEGQCVVPCGTGEFACPGGTKCKDGYCIPDACFSVNCDNTARCIEGKCVSKCDGSQCDANEKCEPTTGQCIDNSCLTKGCKSDEVCVNYKCQPNPCPPDKCGPNQQCSDGKCYDSCLNVTCKKGTTCVQGKCSSDPCDATKCEENFVCVVTNGVPGCEPDPCRAINCPPGQVCHDAQCEDDPCATTHCPSYLRCVLSASGKATCEPIPGAVLPSTKSLFATGAGGCRCSTSGEISPDGALLSLMLLGLLGLDRRRRRRRRPGTRAGGER